MFNFLNVNIGRDHGLQTYVKYLQKYLNINITSFDDLSPLLMNGLNLGQLKSIYEYVYSYKLYKYKSN